MGKEGQEAYEYDAEGGEAVSEAALAAGHGAFRMRVFFHCPSAPLPTCPAVARHDPCIDSSFMAIARTSSIRTGSRHLTLHHRFTVDVEEHFHVNAFEPFIARADWEAQPSRVEASTGRLLDLLARHGATGTFFVVGWLADRKPELVRRIASAGHEIASHSWWHRRVPTITPAEFREDVTRTKARLEEICGREVRGFRAPSFSILPGMEWAFDILLETGHTFDSSVFPIRRPGYGWPGAPTAPYDIVRPAGTLREYPMTTLDILGLRIPAAGGGYLRQFPVRGHSARLPESGRRGP